MKALGITAMILAILSIFVPMVGPYITILSALLAAFAAGPGLTFAVVAILLNVINTVFLSPSLWLIVGASHSETPADTEMLLSAMGTVFLGPQVLAVIVLIIVHLIWRRRQRPKVIRA